MDSSHASTSGSMPPKGVKIFVVVHIVTIGLSAISASLVSDAYQDRLSEQGSHMRLVPLHVVDLPDCPRSLVERKDMNDQYFSSPKRNCFVNPS
mgnify:CR=1 FL=1